MSVIGKNPNLSVKGIRPARTLLPKYKQVIGDCYNLFSNSLPFSEANYTCAHERYLLVNGKMTGPFFAGTPATRIIGGKEFIQCESARQTENTYSEVFRAAISSWVNVNLTVTDNAINSPIGDLTADKLVEDETTNYRYVYQTFTPDGSSRYFFGLFAKAAERYKVRFNVSNAGFPSSFNCRADLSTCTFYDVGSGCEYYGIIPLSNDRCYIYIAATSDVAASTSLSVYLVDDDGSENYEGDGSSGLYVWGANIIKADHLASYIQVTTPVEARPKDQLNWDEATIAAKAPWIRDGFKARLIMHQGTDEMLEGDGGEKTIFAYDTSGAKGVVKLVLDCSDKKLKLSDEDTGALLESDALDFDINDVVDIEWIPDNGSNSSLKVNGGGVDATYTGIQTAVVDGDLYYCMDESEANQADIFIASKPEKL